MNTPAQKRILVVDDEADLIQFLTLLLARRTGHEIESAPNASEALELLKRSPCNLVITDINMPGMSGTSLLREIKTHDPDIEVILLTGHGTLSSAVESLQLQAFDYISKPVDVDRLVFAVRNALTRQALAAELSRTVEQVAALNRDLKRRVREEIAVQATRERLATAGVLLDHLKRGGGAALDELSDALAACGGKLPAPLARAPQALEKARACLAGLAESLERRQPPRQRTDVLELVRAQAQEIASVFPWVVLALELPPEPRHATVDAGALAHAIRIVLENAVGAMSGRGTLEVSVREADGHLGIEVHDAGPGFTAEALEAVERPLASPGAGTGLGLLVVKRVLEQHGGALELANGEAGGGIVTLALPLARNR